MRLGFVAAVVSLPLVSRCLAGRDDSDKFLIVLLIIGMKDREQIGANYPWRAISLLSADQVIFEHPTVRIVKSRLSLQEADPVFALVFCGFSARPSLARS